MLKSPQSPLPTIMEMISTRLGDAKLVSHEIRRLIRDVSNIIGRGRYVEPANLRPALKRLGWEEDVIDYRTLELICVYLERMKPNDENP